MQHGRWAYLKHGCRCTICTSAEDAYQQSREHTIVCPQCGNHAIVQRRARYCSRSCAVAASNTATPRGPSKQAPSLTQCGWCQSLFIQPARTRKYCSPTCRSDASDQRRNPLRAALQRHDMATIREQLLLQVTIVGECWVWPKLKDGYPIITTAPSDKPLHRWVLEAKFGAELGSQAAHHACATSACVNPDHLQPVTHRENMAEMLARGAYVARIRELEHALSVASPHHPLLKVIEVA